MLMLMHVLINMHASTYVSSRRLPAATAKLRLPMAGCTSASMSAFLMILPERVRVASGIAALTTVVLPHRL